MWAWFLKLIFLSPLWNALLDASKPSSSPPLSTSFHTKEITKKYFPTKLHFSQKSFHTAIQFPVKYLWRLKLGKLHLLWPPVSERGNFSDNHWPESCDQPSDWYWCLTLWLVLILDTLARETFNKKPVDTMNFNLQEN